jgi:predicted nucleotidyltransferase
MISLTYFPSRKCANQMCQYQAKDHALFCSVLQNTSHRTSQVPIVVTLKPVFHMVITVVKIESQSFSLYAEIQHFRTKNTRSDS